MEASNSFSLRRHRLSSVGMVLAGHIVLVIIFMHALRTPAQHKVSHDLVVQLQMEKVPAPPEIPVPLHLLPTPASSLPDLPPIPQIDINSTAPAPAETVAAPVANPPMQAVTEPHVEPAPVQAIQVEDRLPSVDANAEGNPKPSYPKISKALGEEGRVLLDVYVLADGKVGEIHLHQSSGFDRLDKSALNAVSQWRFKPARQAGKEIAMWYVQPITFSLQNA